MKFLRRLVRNGNSCQVTIPRELLRYLRWHEGDPIVVELTEQGTVSVRPPVVGDMRLQGPPMPLPEAVAGDGQ